MIMKKVILTLLPALLFYQCAPKESSTSIEEEISQIENGLMGRIQVKGEPVETYSMEEQMNKYNVPGLSVAVVLDGELRWAKGYGIANSETGSKVDDQTLFQAGSISKPLAALAALKLWEEGSIDIDQDVNTYLTGWKVEENKFTEQADVTVRLLLTHSAGMTVHGFPGYKQTDQFPSIETVLDGNGNTGRIFADTIPGARWKYSGGGYTIMEKVVEDVSGMPLEEYMEKNIFPALAMGRSTYDQPLSEEYLDNFSAAYDRNGALISGLYHNYPEQAAAGLWTTPSDLAKYCIAVQEIYGGKEDGFLSKPTIDAMLTKHLNDWGLGPSLEGEGNSLRFGHGGKNAGFTNNMAAKANDGDAIIIMTNADRGGPLIGQIARSISAYYDLGISEPEVIEVAEFGEEKLQLYAGKYKWKQEDPEESPYYVDLTVDGNSLIVYDPNEDHTDIIVPIDETSFRDAVDGDRVKFSLEDPVSFTWNGRFVFEKVED